ncbi:MAG: sodium-dependent bicarbonate transport family permease [Beijerinckiaceae bacterium]
MSVLDLALSNLLSPMVLFFALGLMAALARSDLTVPEAAAKFMALYLMMAIGFKGGAAVAQNGVDLRLLGVMLAGVVLSAILPFIGFWLLRKTTALSAVDAAAVAAHYGSISIVTFVAATQSLTSMGLTFEGYLVAVAAVMETPAILTALYLARRSGSSGNDIAHEKASGSALLREIGLNGSVVMLTGSFAIGCITGPKGMAAVEPFIGQLFFGIICLFLLDMGLLAGRGMRAGLKSLSASAIAFGLYMPVISAALAAVFCLLLGLSQGGTALMITLAASASYIAVPAAMRLALPEAKPSIYLTLSLGVTFPLNLTLGIPFYIWLASKITTAG